MNDQGWNVGTFFSYYTMCFVCPILYVGWKVIKKTKVVKPKEADLVWFLLPNRFACISVDPLSSRVFTQGATMRVSCHFILYYCCVQVWERPAIDLYEASVADTHLGFWEEVRIMMGLKKKNTEHIE
jgi:amino acid transporter